MDYQMRFVWLPVCFANFRIRSPWLFNNTLTISKPSPTLLRPNYLASHHSRIARTNYYYYSPCTVSHDHSAGLQSLLSGMFHHSQIKRTTAAQAITYLSMHPIWIRSPKPLMSRIVPSNIETLQYRRHLLLLLLLLLLLVWWYWQGVFLYCK